jgi:hypothetical protein
MSKSIKTRYGMVDATVLEALREDFEATRLMTEAVDAVERIYYRIGGLREDLLDLRAMAAEVIDDDLYGRRPPREESIWGLAEMLSGEILEYINDLDKAYDTLEQLMTLIPDEDEADGT